MDFFRNRLKDAALESNSGICLSMDNLRILVSLTTRENDYQVEQARAAQDAARRLGVEAQILYADNDAITQSTQILHAVQLPEEERPGAIIVEPAGATALPQAALAAAAAGVGWAVLNRSAGYVLELRKSFSTPISAVTSDHFEIGRIQGRQSAALLPQGGAVLYIQGPAENSAAQERTAGMLETKPANIHLILLRANWTEASAQAAVRSWLKLSAAQQAAIDLVAAQDDAMAMGARSGFQEISADSERDRWLRLPFIGCDGQPHTGQEWVKDGRLAATIFVPPNAGQAIEMLVAAVRQGQPVPERVLIHPLSMPPLTDLKPSRH